MVVAIVRPPLPLGLEPLTMEAGARRVWTPPTMPGVVGELARAPPRDITGQSGFEIF